MLACPAQTAKWLLYIEQKDGGKVETGAKRRMKEKERLLLF